ncbi:unnamed protein product, partial [Meganyctiphanes norvegica]
VIKCSASEWRCAGSQDCIPDSWLCDGDHDCDDKSDEVGCSSSPLVCAEPSHFCDNNTLCIEVIHLCDNIADCKDNSDEGGRCGAVDCELMNCEYLCVQGPIGPLCTCPDGQHLLPDGAMCSQPHPCHTWGTCSQICNPFKDRHKCSCVSGYELQADGYNCKSNSSGAPYLIFSNRHELRSISLKNGGNMNVKALISSLKNTIALDFYHHPDGDIIFWTDVVDDKIYRGTILGGALSNIEPVVQTGLATAEGLAVDWVGENLYWVESNLNQIEVAKLNGSFRRTLIAQHMESPRAISLDPRVGMLFWTDWEEGASRIESASMSGEGRRMVLLVSQISGSGWPNGLTLDYALKRIYWIDAKSDSIHTVLYDGSDHREILRVHQLLSHPFAISLFGNYVYWTDWRTNAVIRANKFNGSEVQEIHRTITQPFDIKVLHPSRQPRDMNNPCALNNGGCSHLCLLSFNETRQCNCPHIMTLGPDEKTCLRNEKVLLFSRPNEIRGVDVNKPSFDIIPRLSLPKVQEPSQLDFNAKDESILWVDTALNEVKRARLSGSPIDVLLDTAINSPKGYIIHCITNFFFKGTLRENRIQFLKKFAAYIIEFLPHILKRPRKLVSMMVSSSYERWWNLYSTQINPFSPMTSAASREVSPSTRLEGNNVELSLGNGKPPFPDVLRLGLWNYDVDIMGPLRQCLHLLMIQAMARMPKIDLISYDHPIHYGYYIHKVIITNSEGSQASPGTYFTYMIEQACFNDAGGSNAKKDPIHMQICLSRGDNDLSCRKSMGYQVEELEKKLNLGLLTVRGNLVFPSGVGLQGLHQSSRRKKMWTLPLIPLTLGTPLKPDFHVSPE